MKPRLNDIAKLVVCTVNDQRVMREVALPFYWQNGGCLIFAKTLQKVLGCGKLHALAVVEDGDPEASHVILEVGGRCFDSLGGCTPKTALRRHASWLKKNCGKALATRYMPLGECILSIKYDEWFVENLSRFFRTVAIERGLNVVQEG